MKCIRYKIAFFISMICIIVASHFFKVACVYGDSMESTLHSNDFGIVSRLRAIENNDIIVFRTVIDGSRETLIKRVIASGGETVKIEDGIVFVNNEPAQDFSLSGSYTSSYPESIVPDNCYFVLGDNREVSYDSRYSEIGFVKKSDVIGVFIKI